MNSGYKHNDKSRILFKALKTILFILMAVISIKIGMIGGEALLSLNIRVVEIIDVENFKGTLNFSLPVINTVYNSGNISVSFTGEIKKIIKGIFGFDLNTPVTILNSQSPIFYTYYIRDYKPDLAQEIEEESGGGISYENVTPSVPEESEKKPEEPASSISYEEDTEKRELVEEKIERDTSGKIALHNETKYKINIDELVKAPLKIKLDKKGPKVLVFHTHTTESYLKSSKEIGKTGIPSWSQNPQNSVVRVGEEIAQILRKSYGIEVIHNGTIHDYPSYNGAYGRSMNTVSKILKSYPSIKVVLDIHRDGLGVRDKKLRVVKSVNGKNAAQVMFVIGTDKNIPHPNWRENLKLALKLQERLNVISPGLAKPIYLSVNRYNQHLSNGALIIEVGGDGNTLAECLESTKYLSKAINEVVNKK